MEIWNEENNSLPIIVSIPHSGTFIPKEIKKELQENIILPNMDWYLESLYSFLNELGITTIINSTSRYVIDVNRKIEDSKVNSYSKNYVYFKTTFDEEMYKELPTQKEILERIDKYYIPYHQKLKALIEEKEKHFDKVYLIDLHSFGRDLKVDIVLGNNNGKTTSDSFFLTIQNILEKIGFQVSSNTPYSGGYIIREYRDKKVETIQIELNYQKYIDKRIFEKEEFPSINQSLFLETKKQLKEFFMDLINICKKDA